MSYIITDTKLRNIADAVRYKCGGYLMNITSMINKISQLQQSDGVIDVSPYSGDMALWYAVRIATFNPTIINTSTMTSMKGMFAEWPFTDTLYFQNFDTSSATDMSYMFENNKATSLANLTHFDTSKVITMSTMFHGCYANSLDLSGWNVSSVKSMELMFHGSKVRSIDLSGWNTVGVTNMYYMFASLGGNYGDWGKIWVPSTFKATGVTEDTYKPFYSRGASTGYWDVYTDATDATTQRWGTIASGFHMHYNSTHQDFINA